MCEMSEKRSTHNSRLWNSRCSLKLIKKEVCAMPCSVTCNWYTVFHHHVLLSVSGYAFRFYGISGYI